MARTSDSRETRTRKQPEAETGNRLIPPPDSVVVRMYRIGHGDCFLLAFPGKSAKKPVYVLIDCGYKPGSPEYLNTTPAEITDSIREATDGHIDVVITHEHQDHVNAFTEKYFKDIKIGQAWFAWTENPNDKLATSLKNSFSNRLKGLAAAGNRLAQAGDKDLARWLNEYLDLELGEESDRSSHNRLGADSIDPEKSSNKKAIELVRQRAGEKNVRYFVPHEQVVSLPENSNVKVYPLGPPRDLEELKRLDPMGDEEFHMSMSMRSPGNYFASAALETSSSEEIPKDLSPFSRRYQISLENPVLSEKELRFFDAFYRIGNTQLQRLDSEEKDERTEIEINYTVPDDEEERRIDNDWLYSSEQLALALNSYTNNTSLVLAFELGEGGKVLLFGASGMTRSVID